MTIPMTGAGSSSSSTSGYDLMILDGRARADTDAAAFITAASISDATQQSAIYYLVWALKQTSLWTKMTACYPFVGGNATAHSKDLKASYNITWSGTITHNSNGITGNGSTGYGDTGLNPRSVIADPMSSHISVYARTNTLEAKYEVGCYNSTSDVFLLYTNTTGTGASFQAANGAGSTHPDISSPRPGMFVGSRQSATSSKLKNSSLSASNSTSASGKTLPNLNMYILNLNGLKDKVYQK